MSQPSQADVLAALQLQSSSSRRRPETKAYSEHADPTNLFASGSNAVKIHCFRQGCGSLILSKGVAEVIEAPSGLIPNEAGSPFANEKETGDTEKYWHVKGGPMAFENMGYSRPSANLQLGPGAPGLESGKKVKWLSCADCDLGPLGWSYEGGDESWLSVQRVRYGV